MIRLLPSVIAEVAIVILNLPQLIIPIDSRPLLNLPFLSLFGSDLFDSGSFSDSCEMYLEEPWFEVRVKGLRAKSNLC